MKRPNWRLYFLLNKIEIGVFIVILIGVIILLLFLFDDIFPAFKYSMLCLKILTWTFLISLLYINTSVNFYR